MAYVKTNTKEFKAVINKYILDCISSEDVEFNNDTEKLQFLADRFLDEYAFKDNLKRFGSYQNMLAEWLQGLPSAFNIDYYNSEVLRIAKEWGSIDENSTEARKTMIVQQWFSFIALHTMRLMAKHNINIYQTKN